MLPIMDCDSKTICHLSNDVQDNQIQKVDMQFPDPFDDIMIEERRKKLAAEGLFAVERKRLLPSLPGVIGVVTSPTGAVIRDILHRLADRCPSAVLAH